MISWNKPQLNDYGWIEAAIGKTQPMTNELSFANIYLLREKHGIEISKYNNALLRFYNGKYGRNGYGVPIGCETKDEFIHIMHELIEDSKMRKIEFKFVLVTDNQYDTLCKWSNAHKTVYKDEGDSDYIYSCEELGSLSGSSFHKKRTNFNKFEKFYPDYRFTLLGESNLDDAYEVSKQWLYEHGATDNEYKEEYNCIKEALKYFKELSLTGGVIYVDNKPVAMTMASFISETVADIHFEKVIGSVAIKGGYAAINKLFAEVLHQKGIVYINREEDIGLEGLRKAKKSYNPIKMSEKYTVKYQKC